MRPSSILVLMLSLLLAGCATLNDADRALLLQHRVSSDLYARMLHREVLTRGDLIELAERRVPSAFVLRYVRGTAAVYHLSSDDVVLLRKSGVSKQVIDYLLATPSLYAPMSDPFWYYDDPFWWPHAPVIHHHHHDHRHRRH